MMREFLSQLLEKDIKLWVDGGRLRYSAPHGVMTAELQAELAKHKEELIDYLQAPVKTLDLSSLPITSRAHEKAPLSFAQQRLWFIDQLDPGNAAYNIPLAIRLRGHLDVGALEQGLRQIVQRHETLRTTFQVVAGEPYQVIASDASVSLPLTNLSALAGDERELGLERLACEDAQRPFDLANGPLVRCSLLKLDTDEHVLLLTMHHIISDGWSMDILFREIVLLAQAYAAGQPSPLPALPLQYADFAIWQREWLQGEVFESRLKYWKKQLSNVPAMLELPTDYPRPAVQSSHGARLRVSLPQGLSEALQVLSRQENVTLFMTLLAAFQVLLARYSGQTDIVVGSPVANRNRSELEGLIGCFVNILVMRADLSGDPSFITLLKRVQKVCLGAYDHQDLPFEKLVDEMQVTRDLSRNPLFQVMFILQNALLNIPDLSGLSMEALNIELDTAQFDLCLILHQSPMGLTGYFEYNIELFEQQTIARMLRHFEILLEGIVTDPRRRLSDLPLLTVDEQRQILVDWNATEAEYPQDRCVHELFEEQVEKTPDAVTLVFEDQKLTYRELNWRANQLAHYLQSLGVGPDVLVGICVERSLEMVVGLLGILKAGGAYIPLDPTFPKERLDFMLADSRLPILLTQKRLEAGLPGHQARVICLDADWADIAREKATNPDLAGSNERLAYVIYTSGSTGRPKGVQIIQRALVNFLTSMSREPGLTSEDRLLSVTTLSFDIAGLELYLPLLVGAQVEVLAHEIAVDGFRLREWLRSSAATVMQATPATWQLLLEVGWEGTGLKVLCGGEALSPTLADALLRRASALWNLYGPTETTVWSTLVCLEKTNGGTSPIGRPIANTQVYVLDRYFKPVPVGVAGELYIGGTGLARGYLNRPDLTAEKFIPDPFGRQPGARLYRTGDLVRWLPDGNLEYLGRIDFQVKVHGFRIELGEIEAALGQHPDVFQAVAVVREDRPDDKRLVAYVVLRPESGLSAGALRSALKTRLPDYMLPATFVFLDQFPQTPNGKIDRKALPAPDIMRSKVGYVDPRTQAEEQLAQIWAHVLKLDKVGIHDNFFELGGDSLLIIRLVALANKNGFHLTPKQVFKYPTLAELADVVDTASKFQAEQDLVIGPSYLTCDQHWYLYYAAPHRIQPQRWNSSVFLQVPPVLCAQENVGVLEQAVQAIWKHHDGLRARFVYQEPAWQQIIMPPEDANPFSRIDLSALSDAEMPIAIQTRADQLQGSLDFAIGPLFRVAVFDLGSHRPGRLLLIAHHMVIDGFSMGVLLEDLQQCYLQLSQGQPIRLPPKTVSIRQWTELLHRHAQSAAVYQELGYWLTLPWADVLPLPVDHPNGYQDDSVPAQQSINIAFTSEETKLLLREISTYYQTSPLHIMLMALTQTIAQWTGGQAVEITCPILGRDILTQTNSVDLSRTVGFLVLSKVLVLRRSGADDLLEALRAVEAQLQQAPGQSCGYHFLSDLRGDAEITRQLKPLRKDELLFNYLGQMKSANTDITWLSPASEYAGNVQAPRQRPYHRLTILGGIFENKLSLEWIYSPHLYRSDTITGLAQFFKETMLAFIKHYMYDNGNENIDMVQKPGKLD